MGINQIKKGAKRGQITLFIIIGIVVLFAFAFVFYIATTVQKKPKELPTTPKIPTDVLPVQSYVSSCLDLVAKEALDKIGKQGGRIKVEGREGIHFVKDGAESIPYWIVRSNWNNKRQPLSLFTNQYYAKPEDYPWVGFPEDSDGYGIISISGVFGEVKLMPLEKENNGYSIQEQLENYISSEVKSRCSDFTKFDAQGLTVTQLKPAENPVVTVTFGANDVVVKLNYPLEIKKKATSDVIKMEEFYSNPQIRLKQVYEFANEISGIDVSGKSIVAEYRLSRQVKEIDGYLIEANIIRAIDLSGNTKPDNIAVIEDKKTNYIFKFAIMNRKPAIKEAAFNGGTLSLANINADKQRYAYDPDDLDQLNLVFYAEDFDSINNIYNKIYVKDVDDNSYDFKTNVMVT